MRTKEQKPLYFQDNGTAEEISFTRIERKMLIRLIEKDMQTRDKRSAIYGVYGGWINKLKVGIEE